MSGVGWLDADKRHNYYWIFLMEARGVGIESWVRKQTLWTQAILEAAKLSTNSQGMSHQRKLWPEVRIVGTAVLGLTIPKCNLHCEQQATHFTQRVSPPASSSNFRRLLPWLFSPASLLRPTTPWALDFRISSRILRSDYCQAQTNRRSCSGRSASILRRSIARLARS